MRPIVRQSAGRRPGDSSASILVPRVLASVELAWLLWFLIVPLPNANPLGTPTRSLINRGWLLLKAFPEVIPDTRFRESLSGASAR